MGSACAATPPVTAQPRFLRVRRRHDNPNEEPARATNGGRPLPFESASRPEGKSKGGGATKARPGREREAAATRGAGDHASSSLTSLASGPTFPPCYSAPLKETAKDVRRVKQLFSPLGPPPGAVAFHGGRRVIGWLRRPLEALRYLLGLRSLVPTAALVGTLFPAAFARASLSPPSPLFPLYFPFRLSPLLPPPPVGEPSDPRAPLPPPPPPRPVPEPAPPGPARSFPRGL